MNDFYCENCSQNFRILDVIYIGKLRLYMGIEMKDNK